MSNDSNKKKRGRPPLSVEERQHRADERKKKSAEYHKATGFAAQKKYRESHRNTDRTYNQKHRQLFYEPKIRIEKQFKPTLDTLLSNISLSLGKTISITDLFLSAVESKYEVILRKKIDKKD